MSGSTTGVGVGSGGIGVGIGATKLKGQTTTQLAVLLARPAEPRGVTEQGCGIIGGLGCMGTLAAAAASAAAFWFAGVTSLAAVAAAVYIAFASEQKRNARPAWHERWLRWNESYFCFRDDVVFTPGSAVTVSSTQFNYEMQHAPLNTGA